MEEYQRLSESLRSVKHFEHLSPTDLLTIVSAGQVRHFHANETIFSEGDPCSGMFVLIRGQVQLRKRGPQGQETILAIIDPVIMFNEVAVLDGGLNPFGAIAALDTLAWQIKYPAFQSLLQRYPQIGLGLLKVLATRNRQMIEHYEDLSFRSVVARVAKLLLDLSMDGSQVIDRGEHTIQEMGERVATAPEAISRALHHFKQDGLIACDRRQISILDPGALAETAQVDPVINVFM